jgi:hypothetical protein
MAEKIALVVRGGISWQTESVLPGRLHSQACK